MAQAIALEIVTPEGVQLTADVSEFTAPSVDGEFGVLPSHRPLLAALKTGIVRYVVDGKEHSVAVGPGFVEVLDDRAVLLTDKFAHKADVDPVMARRDLKDADELIGKLNDQPNAPEYNQAVMTALWAAAQLELYGDPPPATIRVGYELKLLGHGDYDAEEDAPADSAEAAETASKH